ncbi:hypothetical protein CDN99_05670 [Roseateles aquatilis]|uniref:SMODS-associating 2TM beta-strand rich effector domain-containing protein n=1 Tax=Roseateles aquatilis TaxID=431061 RepID=A0A246JH59_9BURK|nr:hypothetical protein [Roseateles aquatilis]OWQ91860.1 hypothetical protein CDN99_05670 [Roseateles aquatilis]
MEVIVWIVKWAVGPVVAAIVTIVVREPLKERLAPLVLRFGSKKEDGIAGLWETRFWHGVPETEYVEVIEVSLLLGSYVGRIVPHPLNQGAAKRVADQRPIRVRGSVLNNRHFRGEWLHPERRSHYRGAFDLIIRQNNDRLQGMWLGYSESQNVIQAGRWEWRRLLNGGDVISREDCNVDSLS